MATETLPDTLPETFPESPGTITEREDRSRVGYLPLYRILMWDDDVTTMEFVVRMLIRVFKKDIRMAERLMLEVHYTGSAHIDTQPLEIAEFRVEQVHKAAALENYPLRCTIEVL